MTGGLYSERKLDFALEGVAAIVAARLPNETRVEVIFGGTELVTSTSSSGSTSSDSLSVWCSSS